MNNITLLVIKFIAKLKRLVHIRWLKLKYSNFDQIITQEINKGVYDIYYAKIRARLKWYALNNPPLIHRQPQYRILYKPNTYSYNSNNLSSSP